MATSDSDILQQIQRLREFQDAYAIPISDVAKQAPAEALHSLREATSRAPAAYRDYLNEAVDCYEKGAYRGAILMVWAATIEHIYTAILNHRYGFRDLETANVARFGKANTYKKVTKKNDLLYLNDKNFLLLCEDAGVFNRNARKMLTERLDTRNLCGHPTGYVIGRDEAVVFIESLVNNIINDAMMDWS